MKVSEIECPILREMAIAEFRMKKLKYCEVLNEDCTELAAQSNEPDIWQTLFEMLEKHRFQWNYFQIRSLRKALQPIEESTKEMRRLQQAMTISQIQNINL